MISNITNEIILYTNICMVLKESVVSNLYKGNVIIDIRICDQKIIFSSSYHNNLYIIHG